MSGLISVRPKLKRKVGTWTKARSYHIISGPAHESPLNAAWDEQPCSYMEHAVNQSSTNPP
ncbi:hypothetical protein GJ744_007505 [Endocarpon pusillum]|uniref:Uncharacterized protein n=1 Tax=Endocarpon pusillum TaxID=364733 RepID=A0A8H7ARH3_9EURO|nr:hypothetical protein GJ744_007505 [Endocarpon pusillum]